jgi:magnesium transporter
MQTSNNFFFSKILYQNIYNLDDAIIGTLNDLVVDFNATKPNVRAIVVKNGKREFFVRSDSLQILSDHNAKYQVKLLSPSLEFTMVPESDILLARDFLDKQIIDVEGKKVERVNDVRIAFVRGKLRLIAVDIGFRGLLRRMSLEYPVIWLAERFNKRIHNTLVNWDDVQALTHGSESLRLNSPIKKLNTLHAADIADILEDLDKQTQVSLFSALEPEVAAEILEEIESDLQVSLLENISIEDASDVLELMPADEAADILEEMEEEKVAALLDDMEVETSDEIRDLMEYEEKTVGSLMMNDPISFKATQSVSYALRFLKRVKPDEENAHYVYIVDEDERLIGSISLFDLIKANPKTLLEKFTKDEEDLVMLLDIDPVERAMERMLKYNLMVLPVVDEEMVLVGMASLNDLVYEYGHQRRFL